MPFIPHTEEDVQQMLASIGAKKIDDLFDEVPKALPTAQLADFPVGLKEASIGRIMMDRCPTLQPGSCYIGAGAYEHHIPAAVWEIATRGEFYTAYTPYQAEASQGSLQVIYEYQTMMAHLMGLDVSNASQYDGASALAEAILMAVRIKRGKAKRVIVPKTVHPFYRKVLQTILKHQDILIEELSYDAEQGCLMPETLEAASNDGLAAVIIPQPNFFGVLEAVDALTDIAHAKGALVIALVNPMAMALLKEPGAWGESGADIACGEGQPLGVPLASGGPYFGFLTCKDTFLRQLPGRIVGRTTDANGHDGFTLTLQAREQHIRRGKATSNICTNQGLVVTAVTIYLSLLGAQGLQQVAAVSHQNSQRLLERLTTIDGVEAVFSQPMFHEFVVRLNQPADEVLKQLAVMGIQGGYSLKKDYPELGESLLICATETKSDEDLAHYQHELEKIL
jgi:glycine dehydrogenase subunit 1